MTGTGKLQKSSLKKFIICLRRNLTARPTQRDDLPDLIYKDQFSKWNAIAQSCNEISSTGQPILIKPKLLKNQRC
jgi:preprotein translocase subunit SecA